MALSKVKIEERRDYELHVKNLVSKMQCSGKHKALIRKLALQCFDDGNNFNQGNLTVEVEL